MSSPNGKPPPDLGPTVEIRRETLIPKVQRTPSVQPGTWRIVSMQVVVACLFLTIALVLLWFFLGMLI